MISYKQTGEIGFIELNNPPLNLLNYELIIQLKETIKTFERDNNTRVIIITGQGERAFVGGVDLRLMIDLTPDEAEKFDRDLCQCFSSISRSEKIFIASMNGDAIGGGIEMIVACDLRIASEHARFGMPEVKIGIPSVIQAAYLPRLIGVGRTAEMVYLGEFISAQEAQRIGLINKVVPGKSLKEETLLWAEKILANGPQAMRLQKKLLAQWMELGLTDSIKIGIRAFRECYDTAEPKEGMGAFLEKRKPIYHK